MKQNIIIAVGVVLVLWQVLLRWVNINHRHAGA